MREIFVSPSKGELTFEQMFEDMVTYVRGTPDHPCKIIIGSDSHARDEGLLFVTAIILHRVGKGARYYYKKKKQMKITSLRQKIFYETSLSLAAASRLAEKLALVGLEKTDLEIHLDVGQKGDTKDLIREIVGMVVGSGFDAKIKPNSYGASKVADKHTK